MKANFSKKLLRFAQGNFHNGLVNPRRRRKGAANKNEESDLDHFLRSCRYLRGDYGYCLFGKTWTGQQ